MEKWLILGSGQGKYKSNLGQLGVQKVRKCSKNSRLGACQRKAGAEQTRAPLKLGTCEQQSNILLDHNPKYKITIWVHTEAHALLN